MKKCSRCGEAKPLSEFHRHSISKDGVRPDCKVCRRKINREWSARRRQDPDFTYWDTRMRAKYPGVYTSVTAHKLFCRNPSTAGYKHYGGRGIEYRLPESYEPACIAVMEAIGPRPTKKHSLDRIDNDGHFEADNLRWATAKEQANNRRTRPTAAEWSAICAELPAAVATLRRLRAV